MVESIWILISLRCWADRTVGVEVIQDDIMTIVITVQLKVIITMDSLLLNMFEWILQSLEVLVKIVDEILHDVELVLGFVVVLGQLAHLANHVVDGVEHNILVLLEDVLIVLEISHAVVVVVVVVVVVDYVVYQLHHQKGYIGVWYLSHEMWINDCYCLFCSLVLIITIGLYQFVGKKCKNNNKLSTCIQYQMIHLYKMCHLN